MSEPEQDSWLEDWEDDEVARLAEQIVPEQLKVRCQHYSRYANPLVCDGCGIDWRRVVDGRVGRKRRRAQLRLFDEQEPR